MEDPDKTQVGPPPEKKDSQGRIGTVLAGRYRIVDLLGEGAQGAVYVGEHLKIGRRDAIKVLQPELMEDADAVARFTRGASKASHINHPNVCTVYDFGETEEGLPFMASELVDGQELHAVLQQEAPFELGRAVDLLEQIAAGLHAAHELDIVHRDLKPANVMVTRGRDGSEVVKVVDFDIAKGVGESDPGSGLTQAGWIVGTPQYMSPEQITASDVDARSDIYSLGLIFFEMITGRLPNDTSSTQKLMWQRVSGELRGLDEVLPEGSFPPGLQEALDRALAKDRESRVATAPEFARQVRAAAEAQPGDGFAPTVQMQGMEEPVPATKAEPAGIPETRAAAAGEPEPADAPDRPSEPAGERPPWTRPPVLAGAAGLVIVSVAVAWGTGLLGGGASAALSLSAPPALAVGASDRVDARLISADGTPVSGASFTYGSTDPAVATVDAGGAVRGVSDGTAYVWVQSGDARDSVLVQVGSGDPRLASDETREEGDAGTSTEPGTPGGTGRTDATDPPAGGRTGDEGGTEGSTGTRGDEPAGGEVPTPRSWAETMSPAEVHERMRNLIREILVDQPGAGRLRSIRDSARTVWDAGGLPDSTRAAAAAAHASASDNLGEQQAFCTWMRRASGLQPDNRSYQVALEPCGG